MPILAALLCLLLLAPATPAPAAQTAGQQACITALDEAGVSLARAQVAQTATCLADATPADVATCVFDDAAAGVAGARTAVATAAATRCTELPDFGVAPTVDEAVVAAALVHTRGLLTDALGSSPGGALIDDDQRGRRCQRAVVNASGGVATAFLSAFERCVGRTLARGGEDLTACVEAAKRKSGKTRKRLAAAARSRCRRTDVAAAFPGVCASSSGAQVGRCLGTRAVCRACRAANAMGGLATDCDLLDDGADDDSCTFRVRLSGDAFPFIGGATAPIAGADVTLLELPDRHVVTGGDGHFAFDDLEEGSEVTVLMTHPDFHAIQTGTILLGPAGVGRVTFQAASLGVYTAFSALLQIQPDEVNRCQMVTTVTRVGKSIYDPGAHGEDGVTVTLDPPLPAEHGPIYFNSSVLPDPSLTQTSDDGGVLFIQVPPGEYVWTAHKEGAAFSRIKMKCRVGLLVNASPPKGLQRR